MDRVQTEVVGVISDEAKTDPVFMHPNVYVDTPLPDDHRLWPEITRLRKSMEDDYLLIHPDADERPTRHLGEAVILTYMAHFDRDAIFVSGDRQAIKAATDLRLRTANRWAFVGLELISEGSPTLPDVWAIMCRSRSCSADHMATCMSSGSCPIPGDGRQLDGIGHQPSTSSVQQTIDSSVKQLIHTLGL